MNIRDMQSVVHKLAIDKGWYDQPRDIPELLCLVHSEISECLESARHGNPPSDVCEGVSQCEEELADAVIRIMDMCEAKEWDLQKAIRLKHEYNKTRQRRHGGKKY